ncbi:hypothetical protein [Flavobacterium sp. A45]|jgi:hypothetical protein|uniref:hypothetical protein n=1 Tax=Flavobacterium sp. A45 TaxID=1945862 RepID=UPI0009843197|nr:hypothetical protein [Flavobacterium sp. A45]OOG68732.1 hypothetical protein B0E44_12890 [Flavobacterium sp. A45]
MKINKIIYLIIASFVLIFSACEPIVEEQHLANSTDVDGVELKATNTTPGGNEIKLELLTPAITGHWNYMIGKALTDRATIIFPVKGTFNFAYRGTLGAELFEKKVPVTIDVLDHPVPAEWTALLGADAVAGKTWIFDQNGPDSLWWFMSPPNAPDSAMSVWWNAGGTCCPPGDANGKMHFDLDGDANYTHYETKTSTGTKGLFTLDVVGKRLIISDGAKMLGSAAGNKDGVYSIVSLTEDKMVLYLNNSETYGTGWTFIFRPE